MSQDIIGTNYHDQNIDSIREAVGQMDDKYPVLLMPVRLETRYMTVDRPIRVSEDDDLSVLHRTLKLKYLFEKIGLINELEMNEAESIAELIEDEMHFLIQDHQNNPGLPYPEDKYCKSHIQSILYSFEDKFQDNFKKVSKTTKVQKQVYTRIRNIVRAAVNQIKDLVIERDENTEFKDASQLIDRLNNLEVTFEKLINKSNVYTPQTKHTYFSYVESTFDYISRESESISQLVNTHIVANTTQINRVKEFPASYSSRLTQTQQKLSSTPSEYKRYEFLDKLQNEIKPKTEALSASLVEMMVPKLQYVQKLKTVSADKLIYRALIARYEMEKINAAGLPNYETVKTTRTHIYEFLHKLREAGHDIIIGDQQKINHLRSVWSSVDGLLDDYIQLVSAVAYNNPFEHAGISRTISHINENYRADLAGLKANVPITEPFVQNTEFIESAKAYQMGQTGFDEIKNNLANIAAKTNIGTDDLVEIRQMMEEFDNEFKILTVKTTVLPEEYYRQLQLTSSYVNQYISQIQQKVSGSAELLEHVYPLGQLAVNIQSTIMRLSNDITDERDKFYDDFRKRFIFSMPTQTVNELWVRIYPDDIFIHSHEKAITEEEHQDVREFWTEIWNVDNDAEMEMAAWRVLAIKHGANRAKYLRELLDPSLTNQITPKPTRYILSVKKELNMALLHLNGLLEADLTGSFASSEMESINETIVACHALQAHFTHEQRDLLNLIIGLIREVQSRINDLIAIIDAYPINQRSLLSDFVFHLNGTIDSINTLSEHFSLKTPVDYQNNLPQRVFPNFPQEGLEFKETSWSEPPKTNALPDRFVFLGMKGNTFTHIVAGKHLPEELIAGINPATVDPGTFSYDELGNLAVDENIKWMTDFDASVEKGMGIIVPLSYDMTQNNFDKIIVLGVRESGAELSKRTLEELLKGHSFSPDGINLLPIGTPTNITESKTSGYSSEEDEDKAYELITGDPLFTPLPASNLTMSDGQRISDALGVDHSLFNRAENADRKDIYKALLMNKVMWPGTMGYYMEEIMDTIFNFDNIRRTKEYFCQYVSGRGYLPSMRIGTQPYGILPTTAFSRYKTKPNEQLPPISATNFTSGTKDELHALLQERFDIRLKDLLNLIKEQWMIIANREELKIDDFKPEEKTAQEHFMQLLGLQATSIEQYFRYNTNCAQRRRPEPHMGGEEASVNFTADLFYGPDHLAAIFSDIVTEGNYVDDTYFDNQGINRMRSSRIFRLRYHDNFGQLDGPFVREAEEEFLKEVNGKTYIDDLLGRMPYQFWDDTYNVKSNSLFFIMLRHSLASAYRDKALDILYTEFLINENTRRRAGTKGTYILPLDNGHKAFDKWDYLFDTTGFLEELWRNSPFGRFPFSNDPTTNSFWNFMKSINLTLSKYLYNTTRDSNREHLYSSGHDVSGILELREHFKELKSIPISDLERMFAEHLDLCTYRFDAWQLGLANKRLKEIRASAPEGIYIGAFGWLENLKPGDIRTPKLDVPAQLRENDNVVVYTDADNQGFIHTPSLNHALTAAILRAGYEANEGSGNQSNPMAVNLTSQRVRMALKLLEGIRNGQDVAALLGYQLERGLHEGYTLQNLELDQYIYDLRRAFPLQPDVDGENVANPDEDRNKLNVVNGTLLLEKVRETIGETNLMTDKSLYELQVDAKLNILSAIGLPDLQDNLANPIFKEIDKMANAFDALGDLLLSESVYHIAQGNHVRSAAVFDALSNGRIPPDPQMIYTPRSGHVITQRTILQLNPNESASLPFNWSGISLTPRAKAEPALNLWLGEMFGDPGLIRLFVKIGSDGAEQFETVTLADLNLQPIDLLFTLFSASEQGNFELNALIAHHIRIKFNLTTDVPIGIYLKERNEHLYLDGEQQTNEVKTINEIMPLVSSLFDIITKSRHTAADDYVVPGQSVPDDQNMQQYDVAELHNRIHFAKTQIDNLLTILKNIFQNKGINDKDQLAVGNSLYTANETSTFRNTLVECTKYGVPNSMPVKSVETDAEAGKELAKQAAAVILYLEQIKLKVERGLLFPDDTSDKQRVEKLIEAAKAIFGKAFSIIPLFRMRNHDEINEVVSLNHDEGLLRHADEFAMESWSQSISKVRTKMNKLEMVSAMAEMFDLQFPAFTPVQLPFEEVENEDGELVKDYWLGCEYPGNYEPDNDKLSLVVLNANLMISDSDTSPRCGLLIDEWIEIIPNKEETTGITFNYDQPDSEPPQSMLLAVTPERTGSWNWSDLVYTLVETMDLYKMRLVEPEHIDTSIFTQVLPAIMGETPHQHSYRGVLTNKGILDLGANNKPIEVEQE